MGCWAGQLNKDLQKIFEHGQRHGGHLKAALPPQSVFCSLLCFPYWHTAKVIRITPHAGFFLPAPGLTSADHLWYLRKLQGCSSSCSSSCSMCKSFLPFSSNSFPVNLRRGLFASWRRDTMLLRARVQAGQQWHLWMQCDLFRWHSLHTHLPQSWCCPWLWSSTSLSQTGGCHDPTGLNASLGALEIPLALPTCWTGIVSSFSQGLWFCIAPCRLWRGCVSMSEVGDGTLAETRDLYAAARRWESLSHSSDGFHLFLQPWCSVRGLQWNQRAETALC